MMKRLLLSAALLLFSIQPLSARSVKLESGVEQTGEPAAKPAPAQNDDEDLRYCEKDSDCREGERCRKRIYTCVSRNAIVLGHD